MPLKIKKRVKWDPPTVPKKLQFEYYQALMEYTSQVAKALQDAVFPAVLAESDKINAQDSDDSTINRAFQLFLKKAASLSKKKVEKAAFKMIDGVEVFQRETFLKNVKRAVGVDISAIVNQKNVKNDIAAARKENFDLISSIKDSYQTRARRIIDEGLSTGKTRKQLEKDLLDLGGFKEKYSGTEQRRARVIARDQSQKLAKSIDKTRQQKIGVKRFVWVTSGDQFVRVSHKAKSGKTYEYANPPDGELPGDAVLCRCHPKPVLTDILEALEKADLS